MLRQYRYSTVQILSHKKFSKGTYCYKYINILRKKKSISNMSFCIYLIFFLYSFATISNANTYRFKERLLKRVRGRRPAHYQFLHYCVCEPNKHDKRKENNKISRPRKIISIFYRTLFGVSSSELIELDKHRYQYRYEETLYFVYNIEIVPFDGQYCDSIGFL